MTDIAERLRAGAERVDAAMGLYPDATAMREAADEIERLRAFVRWALTEGSWRGADLDGGAIQDKAIELNLVAKVKYDPAIHGEDDIAEEGDDWYVPR